MPIKDLINKRAVMVVAGENFRDAEYFVPKKIFEDRGMEVKTASNRAGAAKGADGAAARVDLLVKDVNLDDFDAVVFVGGPGALENLDNGISYGLAKSAVEKGKILSAICIAPVILARAGVLKGKKATVWSSVLDKSPVKILKENGAGYTGEKAAVDGKIITADGPSSAKDFGEAVAKALLSEQ